MDEEKLFMYELLPEGGCDAVCGDCQVEVVGAVVYGEIDVGVISVAKGKTEGSVGIL